MIDATHGVKLLANGREFFGWKSIRVTTTIEGLAGSFSLEASDRWSDAEEWPIVEEDECRIEVEGDIVIDGYVDTIAISGTSEGRSLTYGGRDRAAALVDCSAMLQSWTLRNADVAAFVRKVAEPFGVPVSVQAGLTLSKVPRLTFTPGDGAFDVVKKAAGDDGAMLVSDGRGGILITRSARVRATPLVEGQNIKAYSFNSDASERFRHYVIATQTAATDEAFGDATRVAAGAVDEGVRRTNRVLVIQPERGYTLAEARKRADWEARTRAAKASRVSVTVLGWRQPSGELWRPNTISHVSAPRLLRIDGDMLISQVEFTIGGGGRATQLSLVRPDAFTPEPKKATVKGTPAGWKELRKGAAFDAELAAGAAADFLGKILKGGDG